MDPTIVLIVFDLRGIWQETNLIPSFCDFWFSESPFCWDCSWPQMVLGNGSNSVPQVDGLRPKRCKVQCLLPHEIIHSLADHPFAFKSLLAGNMDPSSIEQFWRHCQKLDAWSQHPIFSGGFPLDKMIPLTIHGDGAQFYREDEMFTFSISSLFAPSGLIQDILLYKFPFLIIPERYMRSESVSQLYQLYL